MAGEIPPILVQIQADVAQLKSGLAQAEASLKGLDTSVEKTNSVFDGFGAKLKTLAATIGVTFAATQVVQFFKSSVAAAIEAEQAQSRLATILRTTGAASEAQIVALNAQAEALEKVGVVTKDNITVTQSQLATFDLQGSTIKKLTPAILDYVTAEKGATASSDDFKQMTNGLAQALNGNFGSLTRVGFVLDEDTKKKIKNGTEAERSAALVEVLNSTYKDFNKTLADTPEGRIIKLKNDFGNLKEEIGKGLLPALETVMNFLSTVVIPALQKMVKFVKENSTELKVFVTVLGLGATAWGVYTIAVNKAKIATALFNAVMALNPIGLIITAIALLVTGFVKLYNSNQKVKEAVQSFFKAVINNIARFVGAIATMIEAASKIPGIGNKFKGVAESVRKASDNMKHFAAQIGHVDRAAASGLSHLAELERLTGGKTNKKTKTSVETDDKTNDKEQKKIDALEKKLEGYYKKYDKVQADALKKIAEAQERHDEKVAESYERFNERKIELLEQYNERMAAAQERFDDRKTQALERLQEAEEEARAKHTETILNIETEYRKRREEITKTRDARIIELEQNAQIKREEILQNGQAKLAAIIEKGRERLRDAWSRGTKFSLTDLFGGAKESGKSLIDTLKTQLSNVSNLQKAAGELAGQGYSQTFIEQIVTAGPKAGMEMVAELRKLSPEQQAEMQKLYKGLEEINANGINAIANKLSTSTQFATDELRQMYQDTQSEITQSLFEVNKNLLTNIAEAKAAYEEAMTNAATTRQEKLAEADKALIEALTKSKETYNKALADAQKELQKAQTEAKKIYDKGLEDAQKALEKALLDAQKEFTKRYDEIHDKLMEQIADLVASIEAAMQALAALGVMSGGFGGGLVPPLLPPNPYSGIGGGGGGGGSNLLAANNTNTNITINQSTLTNPQETANSILYAIQYGQVIQVVPSIVTSGQYANEGVQYLQ